MHTTAREIACGKQQLRLAESHIVELTLHGHVTSEEMAVFIAEMLTIVHDTGFLLLLCDIGGFASASAEARRMIARRVEAKPTAIAYVGAAFHAKVLANMVLRAIKLFQKAPIAFRFFDDKAAANAWLHDMKREYARDSNEAASAESRRPSQLPRGPAPP